MGFFSVSVGFFFVFMSQNHADFLGKSIFFPSCRLSGRLEGDFLPPHHHHLLPTLNVYLALLSESNASSDRTWS